MKQPIIVVLAALVMSSFEACERNKSVIVLDAWWAEDYAKTACSHTEDWWKENAAARPFS